MRIVEYFLISCSLFFNSNGLDCRSESGPKENELKKIYNICLKQQNKNNNSNHFGELDQDWRETRGYNRWFQDNASRNRGDANSKYGREERGQDEENKVNNNRDANKDQHKVRQDRRSKNRDSGMQHRDIDGDENTYSRNRDERMYSGNGRDENENNRNVNRSQKNNGINGRNDFFQNENFNGYNNNQYSTQPPRRYKRERRVEVNSGKRSQYNPNSQRFSEYEDRYKDETKNTSETNSTTDDIKSCAIHCLLEKLEMTDESGMPDRYLVTHAITNDVKDEDLKDFLQESIEECFQILDNENTENKCEFSKNLLMCLSEKGRANCDDWKDDFQL